MSAPRRLLGRVLIATGLAGPSSAQVLFREDFENGLVNWTADGLWQVEDAAVGCAAPLVPASTSALVSASPPRPRSSG